MDQRMHEERVETFDSFDFTEIHPIVEICRESKI